MIPLSGRVLGRASGPSRSRDDDAGGLQYVSWKSVRLLRVFPTKGIYRRKGDVRGWTRRPHHQVAWPGVACATLMYGRLLVRLRLSLQENKPLPCLPFTRQILIWTRQTICRVQTHGRVVTAVKATAEDVCRVPVPAGHGRVSAVCFRACTAE
jgi:hypothetical protein